MYIVEEGLPEDALRGETEAWALHHDDITRGVLTCSEILW